MLGGIFCSHISKSDLWSGVVRYSFWLIVVSALLLCAASVDAQQDTPVSEGIGYPSVAAALKDLKSRRDVQISTQGGWTIITDRGAGTFWSFTPPDHPAHPAAVKREIVSKDGAMFIQMGALCEAEKAACDRLIAEFRDLNDKIRESIRKDREPGQSRWAPSEQQKMQAQTTFSKFFEATDNKRYREAYQLFTSGMKALMSFDQFVSHEQKFRSASGGNPVRSDIRATWYKDPPRAAAPGVYAAFDIRCRFENIEQCTETLILHQQENGEFLVMRHERNYVDKDAAVKLQQQRKTP